LKKIELKEEKEGPSENELKVIEEDFPKKLKIPKNNFLKTNYNKNNNSNKRICTPCIEEKKITKEVDSYSSKGVYNLVCQNNLKNIDRRKTNVFKTNQNIDISINKKSAKSNKNLVVAQINVMTQNNFRDSSKKK